MAVKLNAYIRFNDNARQAMEFYKSVFGGDLKMSTFKDFNASQDPGQDNLIMHSVLEISGGTLMASDTPMGMEYKPGSSYSLSLSGEPEDESLLTGYFNKLAQEGTVTQPLEKAVWGDSFGMLVDQFGISWFVNISAGTMPVS